jgi:hypothetical protein
MKWYIILASIVLVVLAIIWIPEFEFTGAGDWFLEFQKSLSGIKDKFKEMFQTVFELGGAP